MKYTLYRVWTTVILAVTGAQPFTWDLFWCSQGGYIANTETLIANVTSQSKMACCYMCHVTEGCFSGNFRSTTGTCMLSNKRYFDVQWVEYVEDPEWSVCSKKYSAPDGWMLVFRGMPGIGRGYSVKQAFVEGNDVTTSARVCAAQVVGAACNKHWRNPILDRWDELGVTSAKMQIFFNYTSADRFIQFNTTGKRIDDWWVRVGIEGASYNVTEMKELRYEIFEMKGPNRDFSIIVEVEGSYFQTIYEYLYYAPQDVQESYPQFLYATTSTYGFPGHMEDIARAYAIGIFIRNPK